MLVDNEDLPSRGRIDGTDSVQKLCMGRSVRVSAFGKADRHTVPDEGDEGGHAREWLATARAALG